MSIIRKLDGDTKRLVGEYLNFYFINGVFIYIPNKVLIPSSINKRSCILSVGFVDIKYNNKVLFIHSKKQTIIITISPNIIDFRLMIINNYNMLTIKLTESECLFYFDVIFAFLIIIMNICICKEWDIYNIFKCRYVIIIIFILLLCKLLHVIISLIILLLCELLYFVLTKIIEIFSLLKF